MSQAPSGTELAIRPTDESALAMPLLTIDQMIARRNTIVEAVKRGLLREGQDYGVIPGTERKNAGRGNDDNTPSSRNNTLLKPGAEKLCSFFGLTPEFDDYRVTEDWEKGLFYYAYKCRLVRKGTTIASGIGSANSREKKYRRGARACPECGAPTIKRSKYPPRGAPKGTQGGFYCEERSGGCGRQFPPDDQRITEQAPTVDPAEACDLINTLQKMAQKRALVAATLIATNASEFFTQDVEDMEVDRGGGGEVVDGEVVGGDRQQPQQQQGRRVVNEETGEETAEEEPDLTNDIVFVGAWVETLKGRGWTPQEAEAVLKDSLANINKTLQQIDLKGRRGLLFKADEGKYDVVRDALRAKAKQQQQQQQQQQQGGGGEGAAKGEPAKQEPAAEKSEADEPPAPATDEEVASWDQFLHAAWHAVGASVPRDRFDAGIGNALGNINKRGSGERTSKEWRKRQLDAIRAGAFDWEKGSINKVAEALA